LRKIKYPIKRGDELKERQPENTGISVFNKGSFKEYRKKIGTNLPVR